MTIQLSVDLRNARLDVNETTIGTSPRVLIFTSTQPASCAAVDTGSLLATLVLPSDFMNAASGGTKTKLGTWSGTASATGTAGHYRIKDSSVTTTHMQGTITSITDGTGDMLIENVSLVSGQAVVIASCTWTEGNA